MHPRPFNLDDQHRFDLRAFTGAIEQGDSETQIRCYAERATVQLIDPDHPPRAPKLLAGKAEIAAWIRDTCSRHMTHHIMDTLAAGPRLAFTDEICDRHGTQMISTTTTTLEDDLIVQQRVVLVWDGWD